MNEKKSFIHVIDTEGDICWDREFDTIKEAKEFIKDCGTDPKYWYWLSESMPFVANIDHLELVVNGMVEKDYYLKN